MKHSEGYIESRIRWRAKKRGLPNSNSIFFEDLDFNKKFKFDNILKSHDIGTPVLVFNGKKGYWTIFGTKKVISGVEMSFDSIEYSKIDEHTVGDDPTGVFSEPEMNKRFRKFKQDKLLIREKGGRMVTLYSSKGQQLYDMYNIMLMLDRMTKS